MSPRASRSGFSESRWTGTELEGAEESDAVSKELDDAEVAEVPEVLDVVDEVPELDESIENEVPLPVAGSAFCPNPTLSCAGFVEAEVPVSPKLE